MKVEQLKEVKFILHLTGEEAWWLKNTMQNPLYGKTPDTEDKRDREMRKLFFRTLQEEK